MENTLNNDRKSRTSITIDKEVLAQAKQLCDSKDESFSSLVETLVRLHLNEAT